MVTREQVRTVQVPHEVVQRVETVEHVVQPTEIIEEPVVQQIVTVNRRTVQGAPYVANTTTNVLGTYTTGAVAGNVVTGHAYGHVLPATAGSVVTGHAYGLPATVGAPGYPGAVLAANQAGAFNLDAADGRIDGRFFGAPIAATSPQ